MANNNNSQRNPNNKNVNGKGATSRSTTGEREVEVLYQRLGDRVFAFSLVDDEVFFGAVPAEAIDETATIAIDPTASNGNDNGRGQGQGHNV